MRKVEDHIVNPTNDVISITVMDEPGAGGANHEYQIAYDAEIKGRSLCTLSFQNGGIDEVGVNGITQEALLAVCIDRLRSFQRGPYSCRENAIALTKLEEGLHWLQQRTLDRMRRGVEGRQAA
jgi:hypothetical protein